MIHQGAIERLYKDVKFLTSVNPARNFRNISVLDEIADNLKSQFKIMGCEVEVQEFTAAGLKYKNVIARLGPVGEPVVIVGAHYDVAGDQPGADDNASAVAGLLEVARMLAQHSQLKNRIEMVAYCLEEPPFFGTEDMGSAHHAKAFFQKKKPVKAMICLEMIGYFSDQPNSQKFPEEGMKKIYPNTGNFIIVVGIKGQENLIDKVRILMQQGSAVDVQSIALPSDNPLAGLSDQRNYWNYNCPAVMINDTSFLRNPNYHEKSDTIDTLNFEKMHEVVKGIFNVIIQL